MDSAKNQLIDRLKTASTVMVTVSSNPTVDQLAACIGLNLIVNKLNKHGSAVFSGKIPSTLEFLNPKDNFEPNTDSLRDFIISLDRNKADKLRYKVEDDVVKIFITPYRTSLSDSDLEFSQGDFNVDLIIALGVTTQEEIDQAITAHGKILHDATVVSINTINQSSIGSINWSDPQASSLCELVCDLTKALGDNILDEQISTALLTGIVSETNRFSNEKTSTRTMSMSAELMAAGANQQLVASNLSDSGVTQPDSANNSEAEEEDSSGTLKIDHNSVDTEKIVEDIKTPELPEPGNLSDKEILEDNKELENETTNLLSTDSNKSVADSPVLGGTFTANANPQEYEPSTDPLSNITMPSKEEVTETSEHSSLDPIKLPDNPLPTSSFTPPPSGWTPQNNPEPIGSDNMTLEDIEKSVESPHIKTDEIGSARDQVQEALSNSTNYTPEPAAALNAMPLGDPLRPMDVDTPEHNPILDQPAPPVPPPLQMPFSDPTQSVPPSNPQV